MIGNWIRQTTTTTGTGSLILAAASGYPRFYDVFSILGRRFFYAILNADGSPVESGVGYLTDATTMVRAKILATMSGGTYTDANATAVSLTSGTYTVICAADESAHSVVAPDVNKILNTSNSTYTNGPRWIVSAHKSHNSGTTTPGVNFAFYIAFKLENPADVTSMALYVTSASAGSTCGLALFDCNEKGAPGTKILDAGTLDLSVSGMVSGTVTRKRLAPGWYFAALAFVGSATVRAFGSGGFDTVTAGSPMMIHTGGGWSNISYSENKTSTSAAIPSSPNPNDFLSCYATVFLGVG